MKVMISDLRKGSVIQVGGRARSLVSNPQKFGSHWDLWVQSDEYPYRLSVASDVVEI